jgi:amidase
LLCPVMPTAAFPHDQSGDFMSRTVTIDGADRQYLELVSWTGLIGVLGLPSVVAPIGRTPDGLPVGVQIVSPYLHDRRSINVARVLRDVVGGYEPPPGFTA